MAAPNTMNWLFGIKYFQGSVWCESAEAAIARLSRGRDRPVPGTGNEACVKHGTAGLDINSLTSISLSKQNHEIQGNSKNEALNFDKSRSKL